MTGKPGVLQSMGLQRVEQQQIESCDFEGTQISKP